MADEVLRRTPLYDEHVRLGARLVPFAGWEMPVQYRGIAAEHQAVRGHAGLFDVSHMGELQVRGPSALEAVNALITNDLERAEDGQAVYTCCCNEAGGILDDLIVYRRGREDVLVVCNASNRPKISAHFAAALRGVCDFEDLSDGIALLALQGPEALGLFSRVTGVDEARALRPFRFAEMQVRGALCTVARTGYTGEDGLEIFCENRHAPALFRALLEGGAVPTGLGARDTLRLEARLSLYGNELGEETNPIEAGLGWTVKLDKPQGFRGHSAIARVKSEGPSRSVVGFEMVGRGIARHGYPLVSESGVALGVCTSGAPSPTLGKCIGLGYVPPAFTAEGSRFNVDCRGKLIEAKVVKTPFYKRPPAK